MYVWTCVDGLIFLLFWKTCELTNIVVFRLHIPFQFLFTYSDAFSCRGQSEPNLTQLEGQQERSDESPTNEEYKCGYNQDECYQDTKPADMSLSVLDRMASGNWREVWNPRLSMSLTSTKGLLNPAGQNNCFLNSAVQVRSNVV